MEEDRGVDSSKETRKRVATLLLSAALALATPTAALAQTYEVTETLAPITGSFINVLGLGENGVVVGGMHAITTPFLAEHAYRAQTGVITDLGGLDADPTHASEAQAINDAGWIVGKAQVPDHPGTFQLSYRGFLFDGTTKRDLGILPPDCAPAGTALAQTEVFPFAINDSGLVVGAIGFLFSNVGGSRGFSWANGVMQQLPSLNPIYCYRNTIPQDVNDLGEIVGYDSIPGTNALHAFLISGGEISDLGTLGGSESRAAAINNASVVVGRSQVTMSITAPFHAFRFENGVMVDLGTLGGLLSSALDINDRGVIVGGSQIAGNANRAFVVRDGVMRDLNELIAPTPGLVLTIALRINSAGQIACIGTLNGQTRVFLLTPTGCGNGVIDPGEDCDNENGVAGACCSAGCQFEPATTVCRASVDACDPAEVCTGSSAACPIDDTLPDSDADGECDSEDLCTNAGEQTLSAQLGYRLVLAGINADVEPGNEKLTLIGSFSLPVGTTFADLHPDERGARIVISKNDGEQVLDGTVSPGTSSGASGTGWRRSPTGRAWSFRSSSSGASSAVTRVIVNDRARTDDPTRVKITISMRGATIPVLAGSEPLHAVVVLGDQSDAASGRCAETAFDASSCAFNRRGSTLTCRR